MTEPRPGSARRRLWRPCGSRAGAPSERQAQHPPQPAATSPSERGSGTVWMIALLALVWLLAVVAMTAGGVRAVRHRAHATADAAALAAASNAAAGPTRACHVAATIARAARGRLAGCVLRGSVADIEVVMTARVPGLGPLPLAARARAGPVGGNGERRPRFGAMGVTQPSVGRCTGCQ
jgi:secretion/DNA translocation related TadE-like protein